MARDMKYGEVTTEHGDIPADEPVMVFRGRDRFLPELIAYYHLLCMNGGSPMRHLRMIAANHLRVTGWQAANSIKVRTPDSERSRAWMSDRASIRESLGQAIEKAQSGMEDADPKVRDYARQMLGFLDTALNDAQ